MNFLFSKRSFSFSFCKISSKRSRLLSFAGLPASETILTTGTKQHDFQRTRCLVPLERQPRARAAPRYGNSDQGKGQGRLFLLGSLPLLLARERTLARNSAPGLRQRRLPPPAVHSASPGAPKVSQLWWPCSSTFLGAFQDNKLVCVCFLLGFRFVDSAVLHSFFVLRLENRLVEKGGGKRADFANSCEKSR